MPQGGWEMSQGGADNDYEDFLLAPSQQSSHSFPASIGAGAATDMHTTDDETFVTTDEVISRIEKLIVQVIDMLDDEQLPVLETLETTTNADESSSDDEVAAPSNNNNNSKITKKFNMSQCRSFTSIMLVLSFCHSLLQAGRTTTTREVYYFYVTHFRSQKECELAIWDAVKLLQVPRHSLGLKASPKGWFCGDIQLIQLIGGSDEDDNIVLLDGRSIQAIQGVPISSEWLKRSRNFTAQTQAAKCILVIEKEGVYNRLAEDRFFDQYPCILVTGKGFPDLATRALVHHLHHHLKLPVRGLADCDPFGVMVLHTYMQGGRQRGVDGGDRYHVPMEWIGLRPSQVEQLAASNNNTDADNDNNSSSAAAAETRLPNEVFQQLTDIDRKRLDDHLLKEDHLWTNYGQDERRVEELENMRRTKVELEALNWLGMDFCAQWLLEILEYHDRMLLDNSNNSSSLSTPEEEEEAKEWLEII